MGLAVVPASFKPPDDLSRLRRFVPTFTARMERIGRDRGATMRTDPVRLAGAYLEWRRVATLYPQHLAPGVLLRELLLHAPVAMSVPADAQEGPATFWPEGHAYVAFCVGLRHSMDGTQAVPGPAFRDLRTWRSFREKFMQDSAVAVPFLDLFAGGAPVRGASRLQGGDRRPQRKAATLRIVANRPGLPSITTAVLFDLAVLTNTDVLWVQALHSLLAEHGAPLSLAEVRQRFLHQPPALATMHVARCTGRICPGGFLAALQRRVADLLATELIPSDGAMDMIATLVDRGIGVRIAAGEGVAPAILARVQTLFAAAEVVPEHVATVLMEGTRGMVIATTSPATVTSCVTAGRMAIGIADETDLSARLALAGAWQVLPDCNGLRF